MDYISEYYNKNTHELKLPDDFNVYIKNYPNSITHLTLGYCFNQLINKYPDSLIEFSYWSPNNINNLPYIKSLIIHFFDNDNNNYEITNIPTTVKKIKINKSEKIHFLKNIPFKCKILDFDNKILN